jgi:hypothetical protein
MSLNSARAALVKRFPGQPVSLKFHPKGYRRPEKVYTVQYTTSCGPLYLGRANNYNDAVHQAVNVTFDSMLKVNTMHAIYGMKVYAPDEYRALSTNLGIKVPDGQAA